MGCAARINISFLSNDVLNTVITLIQSLLITVIQHCRYTYIKHITILFCIAETDYYKPYHTKISQEIAVLDKKNDRPGHFIFVLMLCRHEYMR